MTRARIFRRRHHRRGQSLVEFALVIPIVLLMFMILVDFGRVIFAQNAINQDAREGARAGAVPAVSTCGTSAKSVTYVQCQYDAIRAAATRAQPGVALAPANITGDTPWPTLTPTVTCSTVALAASPSQTGANDDGISTYAGTNYCFYPMGTGYGKPVVVRIRVTVPFITPIISSIVGGSITIEAKAQSFIQCGTGTPACQ
jgi:Flp pilus assembly protein TadG